MAECKLCHKKGWLVSVNRDGLCKSCAPIYELDLAQHGRIINESVHLINTGKTVKTRLGRCDDAVRSLEALRRYENAGVRIPGSVPSFAIKEVLEVKRKIVLDDLGAQLVEARTKSGAATTPAGRLSPYNKIMKTIAGYYSLLDDVSEVEAFEVGVKQEIDRVRLDDAMDKAKRLEFKGQKKRALDAYMEALYVLLNDGIDDRQQFEIRRSIEERILALGGDLPTQRSLPA